MTSQVFEAKLHHPDQVGAWTFLEIPFSVAEVYGSKTRVAVIGTINRIPFRSSLLPRGDGSHYLVVNRTMQKAANAAPGDTVQVTLETDTAPRTLEVPYDLENALARSEEARARFESMSYSHRKEYVDWIESAKREETRASRIAKTLSMITEGKRLKG